MEKAFSFKPDPTADVPPKPHILIVNDERFELATDLDGAELLSLAARSFNATGTHALISRVISDDDWPRWRETVKGCKLTDFGTIATGIIDLYADFPITAVVGS